MISLKLADKTIEDKEIELLVVWRKKVQTLWHESFSVTFEGTEKWVHGIIDNPSKLLFFIKKDQQYIGQIGFDEIGANYCYIGMVIRGEGERDGSMTQAMNDLITLAKKFGIQNVFLLVLDDNHHAINFYKKIGFVVQDRKKKDGRNYLKMKYENSS